MEALLIEASPESMGRYAAEAGGLMKLLNEIRESGAPWESSVSAERNALRADLEVLRWRLSRARTLLDGVAPTLDHWAGLAPDDDAAGYDAAGSVFGPARSIMGVTHG